MQAPVAIPDRRPVDPPPIHTALQLGDGLMHLPFIHPIIRSLKMHPVHLTCAHHLGRTRVRMSVTYCMDMGLSGHCGGLLTPSFGKRRTPHSTS